MLPHRSPPRRSDAEGRGAPQLEDQQRELISLSSAAGQSVVEVQLTAAAQLTEEEPASTVAAVKAAVQAAQEEATRNLMAVQQEAEAEAQKQITAAQQQAAEAQQQVIRAQLQVAEMQRQMEERV